MRLVETGRDAKIRDFQETRRRARAYGDRTMVRTMDVELARLGVFETTEDVPELETVVPEKPRRGRRPKPRCEHDMILDRCPDCNEDVVA